MIWPIFWSNVFLVFVLMTVLWLYSVTQKKASIVDPWWSMGFLLIAGNCFLKGPGAPGRSLLVVLVAIWALRLWLYLLWRNWGKAEDFRYQAFRRKYGEKNYWWISYFQVFLLQGTLMLVISAPLQLALSKPSPDPITFFDLLGAALVLAGLVVESLADAQLAQFRKRTDNRGKVLNTGLWRYSRHPNYFGEALLWWGFWLFSLDVSGGFFTVFSPMLMTFLLLKVSGVSLLEKTLVSKKDGYEDYVARTSAFVPWPPKND